MDNAKRLCKLNVTAARLRSRYTVMRGARSEQAKEWCQGMEPRRARAGRDPSLAVNSAGGTMIAASTNANRNAMRSRRSRVTVLYQSMWSCDVPVGKRPLSRSLIARVNPVKMLFQIAPSNVSNSLLVAMNADRCVMPASVRLALKQYLYSAGVVERSRRAPATRVRLRPLNVESFAKRRSTVAGTNAVNDAVRASVRLWSAKHPSVNSDRSRLRANGP